MPMKPTTVVLFGATGDLSRRKLLPGMLHLFQTGLMRDILVVGTSLDEHDRDSFLEFAHEAVLEFGGDDGDTDGWSEFAKLLYWAPGDAGPEGLRRTIEEAEGERAGEFDRLHYLSVPPKAALAVVHELEEAGLVERSRIIMEKPFGTDLESAQKLNAELHQVFDEDQIFRIDHFLGKEAAQNILAFRFANGLFEPIWHRNHIDHVQIDVPEELGLEQRASFYEGTGAYRDMVVTHLFQVLAFTAMEPPDHAGPRRHRRGEEQGLPLDAPDRAARRRARAVRRLPRHRGRRATTPTPRRSSPSSATSTTGAGPACPSTCAPASGWPRARGSSRSPSASRRARCSRRAPGVGDHGPDHLTFDLADQAKMSLSFYGKRPGPGHEARQALDAVRDARHRLGGRGARGLRAADLRRGARRPHPVHHRAGHRAALGDLHSPSWRTRRSCGPTPRARGGRTRSTS